MELIIAHSFPVWLARIAVTYCICILFYRLYPSPLAKFPGPKVAALTLWYEFYYDVIKCGQYTLEITEMHRQYSLLPNFLTTIAAR